MTEIKLKKGKEVAVKRLHPWIFSGAMAQVPNELADGSIVQVVDNWGNFLAIGHFYNGSIAIKIISFENQKIDNTFWENKIQSAWSLRQKLNLVDTNCYRLVHGEGDGFPGLILDFYAGAIVFQAHSIGMHQAKSDICNAIKTVLGKNLIAIYDKSAETLPKKYAENVTNAYVFGDIALPHVVTENGVKFGIDWVTGQKTGFFLDQRDNRQLLSQLAKGKKVLNTFCYSGGFSVYAALKDAIKVTSVDSSAKAIALAKANIKLNNIEEKNAPCVVSDVVDFLRNDTETYDILVLDPPAYAKSMDARHRALQAYKRLNIEGIKKLKPGGILFTFSCSQVVDRPLFQNAVVAAALEVGRSVRILHFLSQGADHPVNFFHPEGHYLKGLVLEIN